MRRSSRLIQKLSRRALLLGAAALLVTFARHASAQRRAADRHVVMISIDGFAADYLDDPRLPIPNIRRLAEEGVRANRMTVCTPSVTWPNHTTLVTGVPPSRHGVLANGRIEAGDNGAYSINPRRGKTELCRAETLYDAAHAAGLRTAEINWPVTRAAPTLDYSFPDHPEPLKYTTPSLLRDLQELKLLRSPSDAAFTALGPVARDEVWTAAAAHLLKRERPNLLLLHLLYTDGAQHAHGPQSAEAYAALTLADRHVGDILRAIQDADLQERATVFVVADHGFVRTTWDIAPNVKLREAGLIRKTGETPAGAEKLEYDAHAVPEGGLALVYAPAARKKPELLEQVKRALTGIEGVERLVEPSE
ncbi:MAG TPA: ectonucleotide pyrophosphatase/phosphodiesterase, partial [Armatimonadota bacterium]|nr:ectonucleotide pyrophosphatase/phosphodiesterase [Armatimonadota bacterium]